MHHTVPLKGPITGTKLCLAEFLPYRLNVLMQAISQGLARHYAEAYAISVPEWRIIATLGEFGEVTARDIASHSRMSKVMTSRAAASLLKRKLIARRTNRDDRRETFLRLTGNGEAIYAEMVPKALAYQSSLLEGLSRNDLAALDRIIAHFMLASGKGSSESVYADWQAAV
jgi:DNA-binding MarR family transcriptional regulator